jgi:DNA-binding response OmpR family regulator
MQRNPPAKTGPLPGPYGPAARLLVVDDEPQIREFIARALTAAGYAIDFAGSGKEGLIQATAGDYDLVILDLVMPDMDGREILARLRHDRPDQAVLVLSCLADVTNCWPGCGSGSGTTGTR